MIGAQECDIDDWRQLNSQLLAWECSNRGAVGDALDNMKGTITNAINACRREGGCRASDCEDLFDNHEVLLQELKLYEPGHLGRGYRGGIPPKIKGSPNLERTGGLAEQRAAEIRRIGEREAAKQQAKRDEATRRTEAAAAAAAATGTTGTNGQQSRYSGMGHGNEGRRERWYPARAS